MSKDNPLGPFHVDTFLVPPSKTKSQQNILVLEEFALRWRNRTIVGLDIIHDDNEETKAGVMHEGLTWRAAVSFVGKARKKHISREGMELLGSNAELREVQINWDTGFWATLEGKYWRHSSQIGMCVSFPHLLFLTTVQDPEVNHVICHELLIDIEPTFINSQGVETSQQTFRRFRIGSVHPIFEERSLKTRTQEGLILIMEYIKRERGMSVQLESKTVDWYTGWYLGMFADTQSEDEIPPGRHAVCAAGIL
jgi:hypothetical protein